MPRNGSGTYTLPVAAFVPGTTISSASVNTDNTDIATALTGSVAADGQTSITGPIRFASGTALLPSLTFTSESTTGLYWVAAGKLGITGGATAIAVFDKNRVGTSQDGNQFTYANSAIPAPVGGIIDFGGSTAPLGWLLCSGANFIRASYPELFTVIATNFGSGDGTTTAGLPDLRGRVTVGKDDMGGTAANRITNAVAGIVGTTLGASGGSQSIIITTTTMPAHTHSVSITSGTDSVDHIHATVIIASTGTESATHTHGYQTFLGTSNTAAGGNAPGGVTTAATSDTASNAHTHTLTGTFASGGVSAFHTHLVSGTTASNGSDAAHINVQPSMITNKIIFAGRP